MTTSLERQWYRFTPLHIVLLPLSLLFWLLFAARRALYRCGILPSEKLPVPVIVVGNISVGGSGKTPLTIWLAQQFIEAGKRPGIVSRGFGGSAAAPCAVLPDDDPAITGDEPLLMAQRRLCPVWIGRDRPAAARALLAAHPECDVIICDDGLQHYRLQRDAEIIVVDGVRQFGNGFLLPAGPLRELPSRLKQADAVVINGGNAGAGFKPALAPSMIYYMKLDGAAFYNLRNPALTRRADEFRDLALHALAGIGHPQRFFAHLETLGLRAQTHAFPDHHRYAPGDINFPAADAILMTEKDAVKCVKFASEKCWALRVDALIDPELARFILERAAPHGRQTA